MSFATAAAAALFGRRCWTSLFRHTNHLQNQHNHQLGLGFWRGLAHTAKSHSGMKKRLRIRPNGTIQRFQAGRQHNTGYKARSRKNRLGQPAGIKDKKIERKLVKCLQGRA